MTSAKRKLALFAVMLGALSLSFSGQVEAVSPLLGPQLALVFAGTNDLAALLALNEVASGRAGGVRTWAWVALFLSGGTALGLNTWHAIRTQSLPWLAAVVAGAEPVLLAWVLSHVVALAAGSSEPETPDSASETASQPEPAEPAPAPQQPPVQVEQSPATEAATQPLPAVSAPAQPASLDSSDPVGEPVQEPDREALPDASAEEGEALPVQLIDRAEKLERQALSKSRGKRGLAYREAPRRLGVRYDTARAALDAARARINAESSPESRSSAAA